MGDFNYVDDYADRYTLRSGAWSGAYDNKEASLFADTLFRPHEFKELHQPHFTHKSGLAESKLDRVYSNHFLIDQLDRDYACYTLPTPPTLSAHRAVAFSRRIPREDGKKLPHISNACLKHPDFQRRVHIEYLHLQDTDEIEDSAFRRLIRIKQAMHTVAE